MNQIDNITQLFFQAAKENPDKMAIIGEHHSINYRDLAVEVESTAAYFISKGIKSGDRVLVFVPMSIDLYRILLALFSIGATAVFLDEWVSFKRLDVCAKIANCKGFIGITKSHLLRLFSRSIRQIPIKLKIGGRAENKCVLPYDVDQDSSALITFTTGSTGVPKAAVRTHDFLRIQFDILQKKVGSKPSDIEITNLPIVLFINLGIGATTVICNFSPKKASQFDFNDLYKMIDAYNVMRIVFSPYLLNEYCTFLKQNKLKNPNVTQLFTGGGPVFPAEAKNIIEQFPLSRAEVIFGSTEAEPMSAISMKNLAERNLKIDQGLAVGIPHSETEIKVIEIFDGPLTEITEVPTNEIGEIIVAGNHVLANYLNNPEAFDRNKIIQKGKIFHRTGDSGFLSAENELFLTGRCQGIILASKQSYYPFLVEYELGQIDGIELGVVVELKNGLVIAVEQSSRIKKERLELESQIRRIGFETMKIIWTKIPRDPRHHSKIDIEKLKLQLSKK